MSNLANLLFPPSVPEAPFPQPHPTGAREEIGDMIEALRAHLDMDVAFVSRQIGTTHRIFTHVAARGVAPLKSGDHNPNDNSLCWLVIEGKLPERLEKEASVDMPTKGRVSRWVKHFPIEPHVTIIPDRHPKRWVVSVSCADRPGLLSSVARIFLAHGLNLADARVTTLGARAEDVFVVNGPTLDDAPVREKLCEELCKIAS